MQGKQGEEQGGNKHSSQVFHRLSKLDQFRTRLGDSRLGTRTTGVLHKDPMSLPVSLLASTIEMMLSEANSTSDAC